jgi:hypothetical protein
MIEQAFIPGDNPQSGNGLAILLAVVFVLGITGYVVHQINKPVLPPISDNANYSS